MIDPYDTAQVRAVWERVRAARPNPISAEDFLLEAASLELERSRRCRALARQMPSLMLPARKGAQNSRFLQQLYRKLTGRGPRLYPAVAREKQPLQQTLADLKADLLRSAERYDRMAQIAPKLSAGLRHLAKENRALSRGIPGAAD